MAVTIRPRKATDLAGLGGVLIRVHAADGYPVEGVADPVAWLTPPRLLAAWTAELAGEPIGHVALTRADLSDDAAVMWHRQTGGDTAHLAIPVRLCRSRSTRARIRPTTHASCPDLRSRTQPNACIRCYVEGPSSNPSLRSARLPTTRHHRTSPRR
jgi:hypothetical protein